MEKYVISGKDYTVIIEANSMIIAIREFFKNWHGWNKDSFTISKVTGEG